MIWAFLSCPDARFDYIAPEYSGREISRLADGVIVHQSERSPFRQMLRDFERRFLRTGRTGREKTAHVLKTT
jgi:hypothetical protein